MKYRGRRRGVSGAMLIWVKRNHLFICKIPLSVIREICEYFDARRMVDIRNSTLYLCSIESHQSRERPLSIEVKKKPLLLVIKSFVYLFALGPDSNSYTGNWTYIVDFEGKETRLANSVFRRVEGSAPLYDNERGYCYLFGGQVDTIQILNTQVYKPAQNFWCSIQAMLIYGRSHFTALKYKRNAYLIGGNETRSLEVYSLDTGQIRVIYPNFDINLIQNCVSLCSFFLVGYYYDALVLVNLVTFKCKTWIPIYTNGGPPKKWYMEPKRAVVVGSALYLLGSYPLCTFPLLSSAEFWPT